MKKEMEIKLWMNSNNNSSCFALLPPPCRRKRNNNRRALRTAAGVSGVESVSLGGEDKNKLVVKGDGIDAVKLTKKLRKNMGFADLVKLSDVKPPEVKKDPPKKDPEAKPVSTACPIVVPLAEMVEVYPQHRERICCSIM